MSDRIEKHGTYIEIYHNGRELEVDEYQDGEFSLDIDMNNSGWEHTGQARLYITREQARALRDYFTERLAAPDNASHK